jgi:hypothetical protein
MIYDREDYDSEIAKVRGQREQLQAQFDAVKHTYDTGRIIELRAALADVNRQLWSLQTKKAAAQPAEPLRGSSVFFGSNS